MTENYEIHIEEVTSVASGAPHPRTKWNGCCFSSNALLKGDPLGSTG